jgi:dolichol-phosphate mannosyltransferase
MHKQEMISFLLPAYNAGIFIEENIKILRRFLLANFNNQFEIILVNDGSTDKTVFVANNLNFPELRVFDYAKNKGKGYALKYGSRHAKGAIVIMMDIDLPRQLDLNVISGAVSAILTGNDIVIGSRYARNSKVKRKAYRLFISRLYSRLVNRLFPQLKVSDTDMGLKAFKANVLKKLNNQINENRWSWDLEMLLLAREHCYNIKELPVNWSETGNSTFSLIGQMNQLYTTFKIKYRHLRI